MKAYLLKNIFAVIFLCISFLLLGLLFWKSGKLDEAHANQEAANTEIVRLQDQVQSLNESRRVQEQALKDCQAQKSFIQKLPGGHP